MPMMQMIWSDAATARLPGIASAASLIATPPHLASGHNPGAKAAVGLVSEMRSSRLHGPTVRLRSVVT